MRKILNAIYLGSGVISGFFLFGIALFVLLQVGANVIDSLISFVTGEPLGIMIPSYAQFAGYFLAASTFMALAYTLRSGAHIRVNLLITNFRQRARRIAEILCSFIGLISSAYFTWFAIDLCLESYKYGDVAVGMVPIPLWIPQISMALGLFVLTIAFIDLFVFLLLWSIPEYITVNENIDFE